MKMILDKSFITLKKSKFLQPTIYLFTILFHESQRCFYCDKLIISVLINHHITYLLN